MNIVFVSFPVLNTGPLVLFVEHHSMGTLFKCLVTTVLIHIVCVDPYVVEQTDQVCSMRASPL